MRWGVAALAVLFGLAFGAPPVSDAASSCPSDWTVVPTADRHGARELYGVSASSRTHVWAVGRRQAGGSRTLTDRFGGSGWTFVPSPNESGGANSLAAVSARSRNDVWAVGLLRREVSGLFGRRPYAIHWDGGAWSLHSMPSPKSSVSIDDVDAVARDDVWAVGRLGLKDIEHWNGRRWTRTAGASTRGSEHALAVDAVSASDVWVVGWRVAGNDDASFAEHWDGSTWRRTPAVDVGDETFLLGVAGVAPDDVWAVGFSRGGVGPRARHARTLIEHWDGKAWEIVPSPNVDGVENILSSVVAEGPDSAWAVGSSGTGAREGKRRIRRTLILRWDGTDWLTEPSPNVDGHNVLNDISASGGTVWAVGTSTRDGTRHPLILRSCP